MSVSVDRPLPGGQTPSREDLVVRRSRIAALVVALEGVGAVVAGIGFVIAALAGHPSDRATAVLLGILLSLYGAGIVAVARGIDRDRRWARTPAFLTQFFALIVAWYQRGTLPAVTAVVGLVAVAGVVSLARAIQASED
jgi:multisubunit Na+/H+ antiporter MnhF subunit